VGLGMWWRVRRMREPVRGSLQVTVCAQPDTAPSSLSYSALVLGVVEGPGIAPQAVEFSATIPASRCPHSGQRVPVTVDRTRPSRIAIHWDEVPKRNALGAARAATQRAAAQRAAEVRRRERG
jgi:hypothetical protein